MRFEIADVAAGGQGVAFFEGMKVLVPMALPGEVVEAVLHKPDESTAQALDVDATGRTQIIHAQLEKVIQASPKRKEPFCAHFGVCGGCQLQHMQSADYRAFKLENLRHTLGFGSGHGGTKWFAPFTVGNATRRRVRLAAQRGAGSEIMLGFNRYRSAEIVNVRMCEIILPELMRFVEALRPRLSCWLEQGQKGDVQITILPQGVDVVLIGGKNPDPVTRLDLTMLAEELDVAKLSWRKWDRSPIEALCYRKPLSVTWGDISVPFPPASFLQATACAEKVLHDFTKMAIGKAAFAADLFCGLGGFGVSMPQLEKALFVEAEGAAVSALAMALAAHGKYGVLKRDLFREPLTAAEMTGMDAVIFDPPRGGAKRQAEELAKSDVPDIVAISCDPQSFARDARILLAGGFKLKALLPVDQFLWSLHMEVAAHFTRANERG